MGVKGDMRGELDWAGGKVGGGGENEDKGWKCYLGKHISQQSLVFFYIFHIQFTPGSVMGKATSFTVQLLSEKAAKVNRHE